MKEVVKKSPPGIIAYTGARAVGWCAIAPRNEYRRLETSRILKPIDEEPVWSVSCFFVAKEFRNKGLSVQLLNKAVDFAFSMGAIVVEGYPVESNQEQIPDVFAWTGLSSGFIKAGFKEIARRSDKRPIVRKKK